MSLILVAVSTPAASSLRARIHARLPVLIDGTLEGELERRGHALSTVIGSAGAVRESPEALREIHGAYLAAGAHVVRANTARTTTLVLRKIGYEHRTAALTTRAVDLALEAVQEARSSAAVAGVIEPLLHGDEHASASASVAHDLLEEEHGLQAERLLAGGCDAIVVQAMRTMREALIAAQAAVRTGLPVLVSFALRDDGRLAGGDELASAASAVRIAGADVVMVDGVSPELGQRASLILAGHNAAWGVLPSRPHGVTSRKIVGFLSKMLAKHAAAVGGAAGVGPAEESPRSPARSTTAARSATSVRPPRELPRFRARAPCVIARACRPPRTASPRETSPYLQQHAHNPVDWYPWGDEALERARARGQADPALDRLQRVPLVPRDGARVVRGRRDRAALMNELFVNIKVDREERPDIDHDLPDSSCS